MEKSPLASASNNVLSPSNRITTVAPAVALPDTVTELLLEKVSSAGLLRIKAPVFVGACVTLGAGVAFAVWTAVGVGEFDEFLIEAKLLLAVQIPKVITSPRAKPIEIAKNTSFFIVHFGVRITDSWTIVKTTSIVYVWCMEISTQGATGFRIKGKNSVVGIERGIVTIGTDKPFKIDAPGEYEVQGISVIGINDPNNAKIYVVEADGIRVCFLENVTTKLTDPQVEEIGAIDILLSQTPSTELVAQIDPWVIVAEKAPEGTVTVPKYVVTADKLPAETTWVIIERKG